ncbi:MAG: ABC transporter permease, partial [Gaiellaceae bacterium]
FFSQDTFPAVLQRIADVLPLAYFIQLVTAVSVRGEDLWERPTELGVLAAWGIAGALVAVRQFRWTPSEG